MFVDLIDQSLREWSWFEIFKNIGGLEISFRHRSLIHRCLEKLFLLNIADAWARI